MKCFIRTMQRRTFRHTLCSLFLLTSGTNIELFKPLYCVRFLINILHINTEISLLLLQKRDLLGKQEISQKMEKLAFKTFFKTIFTLSINITIFKLQDSIGSTKKQMITNKSSFEIRLPFLKSCRLPYAITKKFCLISDVPFTKFVKNTKLVRLMLSLQAYSKTNQNIQLMLSLG